MSVKQEMEEILQTQFTPTHIELIDQSDRHIGHAGHDGHGESHFLLRMTSAKFDGVSRIDRQRAVNEALKDYLSGRVHALTMRLDTP